MSALRNDAAVPNSRSPPTLTRGSDFRSGRGHYLDSTHSLLFCGAASVWLDDVMSQSNAYKCISILKGDSKQMLARLNSRVKPTDLFTFGLIPEFTGRLPVITRFQELSKSMLVRIMTEPKNSVYELFRQIFSGEGVDLVVEPKVFEQIAEIAVEYRTGARSLRGIFEELITPILYFIPDNPDVEKVVIGSLFTDPTYLKKGRAQ